MDMNGYVEEVRLKLTGGILELELDVPSLTALVQASFREIQRYIDSTRLATIPYKECIDLSKCGVSSVSRVFRAASYVSSGGTGETSMVDPVYVSQMQLLSGANNAYTMSDWAYNFGAWNTSLQIRNTVSTDLAFRFDRHTNYLYINCAFDRPSLITIEYVPRYNDVSEIVSDYWIDMLVKMSVANAKIALGRIRSRFTQGNALWSMDGETLLAEGNAELAKIEEQLEANSQLCYGID